MKKENIQNTNSILITNATLISMDEKREHIEYGIDILIQNGKINKIGYNLKNTHNISNIKIIDATNKIVMPGLINTHSHVAMSIFRETIDGLNLQNWLTQKIWPIEDTLSQEDIYYASCLSFIEMIKTGSTTVADKYFFSEKTIEAALDTKIRLKISRVLMDIDGVQKGEKRKQEFLEIIHKYSNTNNPILSFCLDIHGLYTATPKYIQEAILLAKKYNLDIHTHFCENENEVKDILNIHGISPIETLNKYFNDQYVLLAHCVELKKQDIAKLAKLNISISHCPISNLRLGCGIADIYEMYKAGICISLGTDGQGSGSTLDLFETMKFTALLQKGKYKKADILPAYEILKMATINGAKALHLDNITGSITIGKTADIIILDLDNITNIPHNDIFSQIVYNTSGNNVVTTIIDGNILMENRKLNLNIDEKDIYNKCEIISKQKINNN